MQEQKIIIEKYPWETQVAIVEDGRLCELFWADEKEQVGHIYKGRVKDVLPGMSCVFVDIGMSRNAFLYWGDIMPAHMSPRGFGAERLKRDQEVWVQVKKEAFGNKGARVTEFISLPGALAVLLPYQKEIAISRKIKDEAVRERLRQIAEALLPDNMGIIMRTACMQAQAADIELELDYLLRKWEQMKRRAEKSGVPSLLYEDAAVVERVLRDYWRQHITSIIVNDAALKERLEEFLQENGHVFPGGRVQFEAGDLLEKYNLNRDLRKVLKRKLWLKNGAYLIFDVTEALTVIDVNSGQFTGKADSETSFLQINEEAAKEIAHQLRLRSIGGIILIDFIDMGEASSEAQVIDTMRMELQRDKAHTQIMGMTKLGLLEMTRRKSRYALANRWTEVCPRCHGSGRILQPEAFINHVKKALAESGYLKGRVLVCTLSETFFRSLLEDVEFNAYIQHKINKEIEYIKNADFSEYQFDIVSRDE